MPPLRGGVSVDRSARPSAGPASATPARAPAPRVPRLISWPSARGPRQVAARLCVTVLPICEIRVNSRPVKTVLYGHNIETTVTRRLIPVVLIGVVGGSAACRTPNVQSGPPIIQPGAPGQPSKVITAEKAVDLSQVQHTEADVQFMQGMIGHHSQALEMTELLSTRTNSDDMRKLAARIDASQADEIRMMQEWLKRRGQPLPDPHAHHHGGKLMPGMLTAEEMGRLAAAKGPEFDRLFLELMIKHHEGALVMVKELFATAGAGQESEIFAFASDVDSDQRMEIDRMSGMLAKSKEFEP